MTDAPVDEADQVVVEFTGVVIKPADGQEQKFFFCQGDTPDETVVSKQPCMEIEAMDAPRTIDLLKLQGGDSRFLLEGIEVEAGQYEWIRLVVNAEPSTIDSFIDLVDNSRHSLFIPSGSETGLKLVQGFTVPAGGSADFTIDFDLRKSVHKPQGRTDYFLRPALRLVDNNAVGSIAGEVSSTLINTSSCTSTSTSGNAVYVYEGSDITPADVSLSDNDPVSTVLVTMNDDSVFTYRASFLPPGDYTIAFTCQAGDDDPETIDNIDFVGQTTVTVTVDQVKVHNFN